MKSVILLLAACLAWAAFPAFAQLAGTPYVDTPTGEGDPYAITCRPPQVLPYSRLPGPEVCKTNAVWARYRKDGMDVAADGIHDVPAEKSRTTNPHSCRPATMGGSGTGNAAQTNFSLICD
jgi:hypothetical protein